MLVWHTTDEKGKNLYVKRHCTMNIVLYMNNKNIFEIKYIKKKN